MGGVESSRQFVLGRGLKQWEVEVVEGLKW